MAIFSQYGNGQRLGFLIVCISFFLCLIGSIAPYWIQAKTSIKDIRFVGDVLDDFGLGDIKLFEVRAGVWYYCVNWNIDDKCYSMYDTQDWKGPGKDEDRFAWINVARFCVVVNIILSFIACMVACCRCMCCSGGRTICHGVFSFFAGAFGICAFLITYNKTKSLLNIPIVDVDYGWACSMFTLGSVLMVIASFLLCCAMPREHNYGLVVAAANPAPSVSVNVSNTTNTVGQYNAGGHIQSFEPLPYVARPQVPPPQPLHTVQGPPPHYNQQAAGGAGYDYSNPGGATIPPPGYAYTK